MARLSFRHFVEQLVFPSSNTFSLDFTTQDDSIPSFEYTITLDLLSTIILCLMVAFCLVILYQILNGLISWLLDVRPEHVLDRETIYPTSINGSTMPNQAAFYQALVHYNVQMLHMFERFVRDVDERRGQRLRASNKLPPLVKYGSHERRGLRCGGEECAICLEDFEEGEWCQVFPVCNHIFHTNCIDCWLKKKPNCPVCRNCVLDV
ncbi:hypothetical protein UlMin_022564 [Ulmus minor]